MSVGSHPIPSRTRKLSLSEPMVLQGQPCGRVGRRRNYESPPRKRRAFFFEPKDAKPGAKVNFYVFHRPAPLA